MRLFVSGATSTLRRYGSSPYLGALLVPGARNSIETVLRSELPWAADNAAFTGFDPAAFCRMLGRIAGSAGCRFVACPDVVADAAATLELFRTWAPAIRALGLPVALVAQDGLDHHPVPWDQLDALFIGGSTDWKLGPAAAALTREAKARGKWTHFGRCNTKKRFRHAYQLGCDSIDGSGFSRWPDQRIPLALRWLAHLHGHPTSQTTTTPAAFFRGGMDNRFYAQEGWTVEQVVAGQSAYIVHVRYHTEPTSCPRCQRSAPDATRLASHGVKATQVIDRPHQGRPVRLFITRSRFRCTACGHVSAPLPPGIQAGCRFSDAALSLMTDNAGPVPADQLGRSLGVDSRTIRRVRARNHPCP